MPANEDQIKYWNEKAGPEWVEMQERMDRYLAAISEALIAFAQVRPGMAVLDVGCGTGATSLALAKAGAKVTGADISRPMLELARKRAQEARLSVHFTEADASAFPFKPDFDLIFSRFGVMFFDDPVAAFTNLRGALKPAGRLAFVCWRGPQENLWASAPVAAAKPLLPEQPLPDPLAPGPFAFAGRERITDILARAGFSGIRVEPYDGVMPLGKDISAIAAQTLQIGPLSRMIGEADDATRAKVIEAVKGAMTRFATADSEINPPSACWLVAARL
jgi:SAM-dependent methyltransferase